MFFEQVNDGWSMALVIVAKFRGGSRTAATSKMELFVIIINGFQPLTFITKCSILDAAAVLDPPLQIDLLASTEIPKKYIDVPENYDLNNHITKATRNGNKFLNHIISNIQQTRFLIQIYYDVRQQ